MLNFHYGCFIHILSLLLVIGSVCGLYFLFRKKSEKIKLCFLYALACVNIFQHLFKFWLWPHMWGTGFAHSNTAYNVCAITILMTPFFLKKKSGAWRETVCYVGTIGCSLSLIIPYWFVGKSLGEFYNLWEFLRFLFCHSVLFMTSLLPALWGMVHFHLKNFWKIGLCLFVMLLGILVNDVLCICTGLVEGGPENMYEILYDLNPLWMMHPPADFGIYVRIVTLLTPRIFLGERTGVYTPILWYYITLYVVIDVLAVLLGYLAERFLPKEERSRSDLLPHGEKTDHSFLMTAEENGGR